MSAFPRRALAGGMRTIVSLACFAYLVASCGAILGIEPIEVDDGTDDRNTTNATGNDDDGSGARTLVPDVVEASSSPCDPTCPGTKGPCGVRLSDDTCIDSTEVTTGQYRAFFESARGTQVDAGTPCGLVPVSALDFSSSESLPMKNVTFCEARAFCIWAGKRLCGRIGGGTLSPAEVSSVATSTWLNACTGRGASTRHLLSDGGCQLGAGTPRAADAGCQGGIPGVVDMVGNVWEWIDSPQSTEAGTAAPFVGGGYSHPANTNCMATSGAGINNFRGPDVGFRCCSP